jgi:hypothetical protein
MGLGAGKRKILRKEGAAKGWRKSQNPQVQNRHPGDPANFELASASLYRPIAGLLKKSQSHRSKPKSGPPTAFTRAV